MLNEYPNKYKMKNCFFILTLVFLTSCNAKWDKAFLIGDWNTIEWLKIDSGEKISNTMRFSFQDDDRYTVDYGSQKELGKYWIAGEYLHTVEDGKAEKKVRITKLNSDTLVFEMNRAGYLELVTLLRD